MLTETALQTSSDFVGGLDLFSLKASNLLRLLSFLAGLIFSVGMARQAVRTKTTGEYGKGLAGWPHFSSSRD